MSEQPGFEERRNQNYRYVNLRVGNIAETSKEQYEGFSPAKTKNKAGDEFYFFARRYTFITGYVNEISWHTHEFQDGAKVQGWNILISTGEQDFMLYVDKKDRPYSRLMSVLLNVNFDEPMRFNGFMGKSQANSKPQKVLLIYQGGEKPVQPKYAEKWVSLHLQNKIKEKLELTQDDLNHLSLDAEGNPDWKYPHIIQNRDETWNFQNWENFLIEQMDTLVIPDVKMAAQKRKSTPAFSGSEEYVEDETPASAPFNDDDDIPF